MGLFDILRTGAAALARRFRGGSTGGAVPGTHSTHQGTPVATTNPYQPGGAPDPGHLQRGTADVGKAKTRGAAVEMPGTASVPKELVPPAQVLEAKKGPAAKADKPPSDKPVDKIDKAISQEAAKGREEVIVKTEAPATGKAGSLAASTATSAAATHAPEVSGERKLPTANVDPALAQERKGVSDLAVKKGSEDVEVLQRQKQLQESAGASGNPEVERKLNDIYAKAPAAKREIDAVANHVAGQFGGDVAKAPLKGQKRVIEKAQEEAMARNASEVGAKDFDKIKDVARNTIVVDAKDTEAALAKLRELHPGIEKFKIVSAEEDPCGYSGINVTMPTASGMKAETQINSPEIIYAKEKPEDAKNILGKDRYNELATRPGMPPGGSGHSLYEQYRSLDPDSPEAKRIAAQSRAYYGSVRKAANPEPHAKEGETKNGEAR